MKVINIKDIENLRLFKYLDRNDLIDRIGVRNLHIKNDYKELRRQYSQGDSIFYLSEKYSLSEDTINTILFRKRRKK